MRKGDKYVGASKNDEGMYVCNHCKSEIDYFAVPTICDVAIWYEDDRLKAKLCDMIYPEKQVAEGMTINDIVYSCPDCYKDVTGDGDTAKAILYHNATFGMGAKG